VRDCLVLSFFCLACLVCVLGWDDDVFGFGVLLFLSCIMAFLAWCFSFSSGSDDGEVSPSERVWLGGFFFCSDEGEVSLSEDVLLLVFCSLVFSFVVQRSSILAIYLCHLSSPSTGNKVGLCTSSWCCLETLCKCIGANAETHCR